MILYAYMRIVHSVYTYIRYYVVYIILYYTVGKARLLRSIINFNEMLNDRDRTRVYSIILCYVYIIFYSEASGGQPCSRRKPRRAALTIFRRDENYHYFIILLF